MIKEEIIRLTKAVKPLIEQPGVGDFYALLKVTVEQWKEDLIDAKGDDILLLQGAIRKVKDILLDLKRKTSIQEYRNGAYNGEGT